MRTKLLSALCVLCLALGLCACSGGDGTTDTTAKADMEDLQAALLAADPSLPEMLSVTGDVEDAARLFTYVSDFPYEKVENFLLSYSATGKADEIAVIAVKDPARPSGGSAEALPPVRAGGGRPRRAGPGLHQRPLRRAHHLRRRRGREDGLRGLPRGPLLTNDRIAPCFDSSPLTTRPPVT